MSADLLDMLISDILSTTETLMNSDATELAAFARPQAPRIERAVTSLGHPGESWLERGKKLVGTYVHKEGKKSPSAEEKEGEGWMKWRTKGVFSSTC
jgi:hypothetical protein